jgi:hypothetical protein
VPNQRHQIKTMAVILRAGADAAGPNDACGLALVDDLPDFPAVTIPEVQVIERFITELENVFDKCEPPTLTLSSSESSERISSHCQMRATAPTARYRSPKV